jgi:RNA polymerase sigma-70 factor (ECF subfamily)
VLEKVERGRPGGFQAFLHAVVRNVAREFEATRRRHAHDATEPLSLDRIVGGEKSLDDVFDQNWAQSVMNQARRLMAARAAAGGDAARRRVELLRLRFEQDRPIRDIATQWGEDAAHLHHEFARARREFDLALHDSVAFHGAASAVEIEAECLRLLAALA